MYKCHSVWLYDSYTLKIRKNQDILILCLQNTGWWNQEMTLPISRFCQALENTWIACAQRHLVDQACTLRDGLEYNLNHPRHKIISFRRIPYIRNKSENLSNWCIYLNYILKVHRTYIYYLRLILMVARFSKRSFEPGS